MVNVPVMLAALLPIALAFLLCFDRLLDLTLTSLCGIGCLECLRALVLAQAPRFYAAATGTRCPDHWVSERGLDDFELTTSPAKIQNLPQMGRGDRVVFYAVIHSRVFVEGGGEWLA